MTSYQIRCLNLYERELRPGLPPIDRNVELNFQVLAEHVCQMRDMFCFSNWPRDKVYAAAVIYLCWYGYDPEEELVIAKRVNQTTTLGEGA